jgi:hypothetical protein
LGLCNDRPEWAELWSHVVLKRAEPKNVDPQL